MKKTMLSLVSSLFFVFASNAASPAKDYSVQAKQFAQSSLREFSQDPDIIAAIKAQNTAHANFSAQDIKALDERWINGDMDLINSIQGSPLSQKLRQMVADSKGLFKEVFIIDNKGLNVAQSDTTSDYWQGDESKWQNTYLKGKDSIDISPVAVDESTQTILLHISIPVMDGDQVIGVLTAGVQPDLL
jgi:hypothetical protein